MHAPRLPATPREATGLSTASRSHASALLPLLLFACFLALRLPFRAEFPVNWDAVNFALGTKSFNILQHQPHPPGYIGYVALGWLLNHITGEANASLTLLSVLSGAVAPAGLFLLACHFMTKRYALVTAVLFGLSPVMWYYSEVALTYSVAVAVGLMVLWAAYRARTQRSVRYLFLATLLLALLGAIRQSEALLLMPLWLYIAWAFPWRVRVRALGALVAGNLAWLVPLLWLTGGPEEYISEALALANAAVVPVSLLSLNPWGLLRNAGFVLGGFVVGLNVGLVLIVVAYRRGINPVASLSREERIFFLLWIAPALLVYLVLHTGQVGYVLPVLPAGFLWTGTALAGLLRQRSGRRWQPASRRVPAGRQPVLVALVVLFALANIASFFVLPKVLYALAEREEAAVISKLTVGPDGDPEGETEGARQYDLPRNDAHWDQLIDLTRRFDPASTAVLAVPASGGSFRHLSYYLEEYRVYAVGPDEQGSFGHLFTAKDDTSNFSIEGLRSARESLALPSRVRRLVIPDQRIYRYLGDSVPHYKRPLGENAVVVIASVPPGAVLHFESPAEGVPQLVPVRPGASRPESEPTALSPGLRRAEDGR